HPRRLLQSPPLLRHAILLSEPRCSLFGRPARRARAKRFAGRFGTMVHPSDTRAGASFTVRRSGAKSRRGARRADGCPPPSRKFDFETAAETAGAASRVTWGWLHSSRALRPIPVPGTPRLG